MVRRGQKKERANRKVAERLCEITSKGVIFCIVSFSFFVFWKTYLIKGLMNILNFLFL